MAKLMNMNGMSEVGDHHIYIIYKTINIVTKSPQTCIFFIQIPVGCPIGFPIPILLHTEWHAVKIRISTLS